MDDVTWNFQTIEPNPRLEELFLGHDRLRDEILASFGVPNGRRPAPAREAPEEDAQEET